MEENETLLMLDDANQRLEERCLAGTPHLEVRRKKKTPLMSAELRLIHPASR